MILADFIEKPSQNCSEEDLKTGVEIVIAALHEDSTQIVSLIKNYIGPATYALNDLAIKMRTQNCIKQFAILYDNHIDELIDMCVWGWHDLKRFIDNQPDYLDKIMNSICKNEDFTKRLLTDTKNSKDIIDFIKELNPDYEFPEQFADLSPSSRLGRP